MVIREIGKSGTVGIAGMRVFGWIFVVVAAVAQGQTGGSAAEKQAKQSAAPKPVAETIGRDEANRSREDLQGALEQVGPMRLRNLETDADIDRVEHPVLQYSAPMWGGHHGSLWIWGPRGRPVAVLECR